MSKWKAWAKQDSYFALGLAASVAVWAIPSSLPYALRLFCGFSAGVVLLCWFIRRQARGAGVVSAQSTRRDTPRSLLASVAGRSLVLLLLLAEMTLVTHGFGVMLWSWLVAGRSGPTQVATSRGQRALKWLGHLVAAAQFAVVALGAYQTFNAGPPEAFSLQTFAVQGLGLVVAAAIDPICRRRFPISGFGRLTEYAPVALPLRTPARR